MQGRGVMICGIDPGLSGAIAWLSDDGVLVTVEDLPTVAVKVGSTMRRRVAAAVLASILTARRPVHVMIEEVASMPKDGPVGAFSFGRTFGTIEGVVAGMGVGYSMVRPQAWKRALGVPADKGGARMRAMQLWPGAADLFKRVKDDGRAEAAMIGLHACHVLQGVERLSMPVPVAPLREVA